jgi:hypothetical protein
LPWNSNQKQLSEEKLRVYGCKPENQSGKIAEIIKPESQAENNVNRAVTSEIRCRSAKIGPALFGAAMSGERIVAKMVYCQM